MKRKLYLILFLLGIVICSGIKVSGATVDYVTPPPESDLDFNAFYQLIPNSNSFIDTRFPQSVVVTTKKVDQKGGLYAKQKVNLAYDFKLDAYVYLHHSTDNGDNSLADGMAVVFQNDPRGANAVGAFGSALGFNGTQESKKATSQYIQNGLVAELDPFLNKEADKGLADKGGHIAWQVPQAGKGSGSSHKDVQYIKFRDHDGSWEPVTVTWVRDPKTLRGGTFTLSYGNIESKYKLTDYQNTFKTNQVYFGFVGSTGMLYSDQAIDILGFENPEVGIVARKAVTDLAGNSINDRPLQEGQKIRYQIRINNPNPYDTTGNFEFNDQLPAALAYRGNATLNDGQTTTKLADAIYDSKAHKIQTTYQGNLQADSQNAMILSFDAQVKPNMAGKTAVNEAEIFSPTDLGYKTNQVRNPITTPQPQIEKQVSNLTTNANADYQDQTAAYPGDQLAYRIKILGGYLQHLGQLKLADQLPKQFNVKTAQMKLIENQHVLKQQTFMPNQSGLLDVDHIFNDAITVRPNDDSYLEIDYQGQVAPDALAKLTTSQAQGTHFENSMTITNSSYGDNGGQGWVSNAATVNLKPLVSEITKKVKLADSAQYSNQLATSPGNRINYQVTIKPDPQHPVILGQIQLQDNFDQKLNNGLQVNQIIAHYYDAQNQEIRAQREQLTLNQKNIVTLTHAVAPKGHVSIDYTLTITDAITEGKVPNIAVITSDSYGLNDADQQRNGWVSNEADLQITKRGQITIKYLDRQTNQPIKSATIDQTGSETLTGLIGTDQRIQPKDLGPLGYTLVDSTDQLTAQPTWQQPAVDYPLKFAGTPQVITYRYEQARIGIRVPKTWDFGTYHNGAVAQTYYLKASEPYRVDVVDYYTTKQWTLAVKQDNQFTGETTQTINGQTHTEQHQLTNASLSLKNGNVSLSDNDQVAKGLQPTVTANNTLVPGDSQPAMLMQLADASTQSVYATHGFGTWHYHFGTKANASRSIGLHVPGSTQRYKTTYHTRLIWTVTIGE